MQLSLNLDYLLKLLTTGIRQDLGLEVSTESDDPADIITVYGPDDALIDDHSNVTILVEIAGKGE